MAGTSHRVYLNVEMARTVEAEAENRDKSVSELYRDAMTDYLENTE